LGKISLVQKQASSSIYRITKTISETNNKGAEWVRSILSTDNKQEDEVLEALTLEFKTLLKHVMESIGK
jgi:hypothetical protein